jgi:hypothetical protein
MGRLIRDLAYACALGWILGRAIRILIERGQNRRHRNERMTAVAAVPRIRASHAPELAERWHGRNPTSIG